MRWGILEHILAALAKNSPTAKMDSSLTAKIAVS
jgi:hypothetical protein